MTLEASVQLTVRLVSFTVFLQAVEILLLSRQPSFQHIWSYENLKHDLQTGLPFNPKITETLFSIPALQRIAAIQILLACLCMFEPYVSLLIGLFLTHLLICIRFRGSFNGGSDMMTFVVLTGAILSQFGFAKIGLIYIATHTLYSYFKAGIAKIKHREWYNGQAVPTFLSRSLFPGIQNFSKQLVKFKTTNVALGLGTLLFEFLAIGLLFAPGASHSYFALAVVFHLAIYFCFGLNRFFWIWISAWPATLFSLSLLNSPTP